MLAECRNSQMLVDELLRTGIRVVVLLGPVEGGEASWTS